MQTYIKITAQELEDFLVHECIKLKQYLKQTTRDYLWSRAVSRFGSPMDSNGDPIGPGGQLITRQMMENVALRAGKAYLPSKSRNVRSKIVF